MKLNTLFEQKKIVFSFEVFPPKKTSSIQTIYDTLDALSDLNPDFISVTSVSYTHLDVYKRQTCYCKGCCRFS